MYQAMNALPVQVLSKKATLDVTTELELLAEQRAAEGSASNDAATSAKTVEPVDQSKVDGALETHFNVMPFFAGGMLILLAAAIIMRPGSGKRKAIGNETVRSAKLLIKNDEHAAAIEMLNEHLVNNPGDDRAKSLLKKAMKAN